MILNEQYVLEKNYIGGKQRTFRESFVKSKL